MSVIKSIKKIRLVVLIAMIGLTSATIFTSCKKDGCTDPNANNFDSKAGKNDGTCSYPVINVTATGQSGDINGAGGTASRTTTFTNNNATVGWDMSINATSGSFQLVIKDAAGAIVMNRTLTAGSGPQSASGSSLSGTTGTWSATVTLDKFTGTGDYSFL